MKALSLNLLLVSVFMLSLTARAQDDTAPVDDTEDTYEDECEDCEEAWEYVEYLKNEVGGKVEEILQKTLYEARERTGLLVLEETVAKAMDQVMDIRESLLERIKAIRKEDGITICPEQNIKQEEKLSELRMEVMGILLRLVDSDAASVESLKEIGNVLLQFKITVADEVMRLLMLPQPKCNDKPKEPSDCTECDSIKGLSDKVENLIKCAEKKEEDTEEGEATEQEEQTEEAEEEEECMAPSMYAMELIFLNEEVDEEIKNLYTKIISSETEEARNEGFQTLNNYKGIRDSIDEVIIKLMDETDEAKMKKIIPRNLRGVRAELKSLLKDCRQKYCGGGCESCAAEVLTDAISRMETYRIYFERAANDPDAEGAEESAKESIRTDMIRYLNEISDSNRIIITEKVETGVLDECQQEKFDIYKQIKPPLWMLVNSTIFAPNLDNLETMVVEMTNSMDTLLNTYCTDDKPAPITDGDGPNCEWDEYEETKKYLTKVDEIIQEALFKAKEDNAQMTALLGFVDVQGMMDKRVKVLFENSLTCPDEVNFIKKEYMAQLNKCMAEFMNGKLKFGEMSRIQRISCTKVMRNKMEDRMSYLLSFELDKSLNQIKDQEQSGTLVA